MKAAFFDFDGVLSRGFYMFKIWRYFHKQGYSSSGSTRTLFSCMNRYLRRKITYPEFVTLAIDTAADCVKGVDEKRVKSSIKDFMEKSGMPLFPYSTELIRLFKRKNYRIVIISGSPMELLEAYNKKLKADELYGTQFEIRNGKYTGKMKFNAALQESKKHVMDRMKRIDMENSFGFGDTEQDLPILEEVGNPVAVNPKQGLKEIAAARGWSIFTSRNDIIGEMRAII